jgi:hypothetical protein
MLKVHLPDWMLAGMAQKKKKGEQVYQPYERLPDSMVSFRDKSERANAEVMSTRGRRTQKVPIQPAERVDDLLWEWLNQDPPGGNLGSKARGAVGELPPLFLFRIIPL